MPNNILKKLLKLVPTSFKGQTIRLSKDEKEELKYKTEESNLKNLVYLNLAILLINFLFLIVDAKVYLDSSIALFPSHNFILFIHILTIPIFLSLTGLIYYSSLKNYNKPFKYYKALIVTNVLVLILLASYYNYFELLDFNVGITLLIFPLVMAIILVFSLKIELIIISLFATAYYSILFLLDINFQENPMIFLNGIVVMFLYILLATIISKQKEKSYLNEILLKKRNDQLYETQEQIEQQNLLLKESNEKLSRFASMAAHDLKGPLRTTKSLLDILYLKYNTTFEEEDKPILEHVMKTSKDLSNLVNNLLLFSSLTQELPSVEKIDVKQIITNVKESLQVDIQNFNVEVNVASDLQNVKANPNLVFQLFLNLISNSIKFSKNAEQKKIIIDSKKMNNGFIRYCIKDFGIGIPEEKKNKIFDLFFKVHSNDEYSGSGMGLSICKKILDYYNGDIWFLSKPNKGITFYFTLPVVD